MLDQKNIIKRLSYGVKKENFQNISHDKFSKNDWVFIEKSLTREKTSLLKLISDNSEVKDEKHHFPVLGEEVYLFYRKRFCYDLKFELVGKVKFEEKKKNKKTKKSSREIIIEQNKLKQRELWYQETVGCKSRSKEFILKPKEDLPIEFRFLRFYTLIKRYHKNKKDFYFWIVMGILSLTRGKEIKDISKTSLLDLESVIEKVKRDIHFTYEELIDLSPELTVSRPNLLNSWSDIKLRDFQEKFKKLDWFGQENFVVFLNAMIASGKTTIGVALAAAATERSSKQFSRARSQNLNLKGYPFARVIFVCANRNVRLQYGQLVTGAGYAVTIANYNDKTKKTKLVSSWRCTKVQKNRKTKSKNRRVRAQRNKLVKNIEEEFNLQSIIIAGPRAALDILYNSTSEQLHETIVFGDEFTMSADKENQELTKYIAGILASGIRQLVLSSATLPKVEELESFIDGWKNQYPSGKIIGISAINSQIGCQIISLEGKHFILHQDCKNKEDVELILKRLEEEPFVRRIVCPDKVLKLYKEVRKIRKDIFYIEEVICQDLKNLSHTGFVHFYIKLLGILKSMGGEEIIGVCERCFVKDEIKTEIKYENLLNNELKEIFDRPTLIRSENCESVLREMLKKKLGDGVKYIREIQKVIRFHQDRSKLKEKKQANLNKKTTNHGKGIIQNEINDMITIPDSELLSGLCDGKFGSSIAEVIIRLEAPDEWRLGLLLGVGLYGTFVKSKSYENLVRILGESGRLRYIISDETIIYGTDWPFGIVLCAENTTDSIASWFQTAGRSGRVNSKNTSTSTAYVLSQVEKKITDFIYNPENSCTYIEGKNMSTAYDSFIDEFGLRKIEEKEERTEKKITKKKESVASEKSLIGQLHHEDDDWGKEESSEENIVENVVDDWEDSE